MRHTRPTFAHSPLSMFSLPQAVKARKSSSRYMLRNRFLRGRSLLLPFITSFMGVSTSLHWMFVMIWCITLKHMDVMLSIYLASSQHTSNGCYYRNF